MRQYALFVYLYIFFITIALNSGFKGVQSFGVLFLFLSTKFCQQLYFENQKVT